MADVTNRLFLRHLRGTPTVWVRFQKRGRDVKEGTGQSFWYRPSPPSSPKSPWTTANCP
nr:hypothetical protein GCM10025732_34490 [Glycomyces mayteni]